MTRVSPGCSDKHHRELSIADNAAAIDEPEQDRPRREHLVRLTWRDPRLYRSDVYSCVTFTIVLETCKMYPLLQRSTRKMFVNVYTVLKCISFNEMFTTIYQSWCWSKFRKIYQITWMLPSQKIKKIYLIILKFSFPWRSRLRIYNHA